MEKPPSSSGRRSAGMLGSPAARRGGPDIPGSPPANPRAMPSPSLERPQSKISRYPKPKVLVGEVAAPRGTEIGEYREAFRAFMTARRLRPSDWAKKAGVPMGEIMAYLTGRQRFFAPGVAEKLAAAADATTDEMFGQR